MPYDTIADLPDAVKGLPKHAKEIYKSAYNSASKDNDEGSSAAIAWAAVKNKYKKNEEGNWVAKEATGDMSDDNKRELLQKSLISHYGLDIETPKPDSIYVRDVFDEEIIYCIDGQDYRMSYEMSGESKITFGEPEKVKKVTTYEPMEALKNTYQEIIQEAGRRNANLDSTRIKKIVALCQELLSSESEHDEKRRFNTE